MAKNKNMKCTKTKKALLWRGLIIWQTSVSISHSHRQPITDRKHISLDIQTFCSQKLPVFWNLMPKWIREQMNTGPHFLTLRDWSLIIEGVGGENENKMKMPQCWRTSRVRNPQSLCPKVIFALIERWSMSFIWLWERWLTDRHTGLICEISLIHHAPSR